MLPSFLLMPLFSAPAPLQLLGCGQELSETKNWLPVMLVSLCEEARPRRSRGGEQVGGFSVTLSRGRGSVSAVVQISTPSVTPSLLASPGSLVSGPCCWIGTCGMTELNPLPFFCPGFFPCLSPNLFRVRDPLCVHSLPSGNEGNSAVITRPLLGVRRVEREMELAGVSSYKNAN